MTGYATLVNDLQNLLVDNGSSDFTSILPTAINYAESLIYSDLDFLDTRDQDTSVTFTTGNRQITIPATTIIVQGLAAITPAGSLPIAGTRNPLERVSLDAIDMFWPVEATTGLPTMFAMKTDTLAVVAPTPAANYKAEFTGIFRPTALSVSNTDTYLTDSYYPLMLSACMVFLTGWQKDFGANVDDPQQGVNWNSEYKKLKDSAMSDAIRQKAQMPGGNSYPPSPADTKGS